jgi:hypothetical protein
MFKVVAGERHVEQIGDDHVVPEVAVGDSRSILTPGFSRGVLTREMAF